jgi:hypothetical protein
MFGFAGVSGRSVGDDIRGFKQRDGERNLQHSFSTIQPECRSGGKRKVLLTWVEPELRSKI